MTTKHIKASLSFIKDPPLNRVSLATAVYTGLDGNEDLPHPPIDLSVFKAAIDSYSTRIVDSLDGGKKALGLRDQQGEVLIKMLRQLAHYVEANCKDDITIFRSSGFEPVSSTRTATQPLSQRIRKITPGGKTGEMLISIVRDPEAFSYELRWTPTGNGATTEAWSHQGVPMARPPVVVGSLTPGTPYAFQVRALTASGYTDWSDPVTRICM